MKKTVISSAILITALGFYWSKTDLSKVNTEIIAPAPPILTFKPKIPTSNFVVDEKACKKIPALKNLQKSAQKEKNNIFLPDKLTRNMDYLLSESKLGNGSASIILFAGLRGCSHELSLLSISDLSQRKFSEEECARLPPELLQNPLDILVSSAENNSNEARLLYIKNAPVFAEITRSKYGKISAAVEKIYENSKRYGIEAVQSGSSDAYALMAYSYYSGSLGSVDFVSAYAYTLAAQASGDAENDERLKFLFPQLTRDQYLKALDIVGDCGGSVEQSDIHQNPFS